MIAASGAERYVLFVVLFITGSGAENSAPLL
jgi:hypothetical protein